jgi:hypothetical protein
MTISELKELSSNIQEFLNSQEVKTNKSSDKGKVKLKSQEIFNSFGVKKLTSNELKQLRLKVQKILISHDMKFIKNGGFGSVSFKYQEILNSHGLKKISDNGISKLRMKSKEVMWKYYSVNKSNSPDYIGELRDEIITELMKGRTVGEVFDPVLVGKVLRVA